MNPNWDSLAQAARETHQLPPRFGSLVLWMEHPPAFATIETEEFDTPYWALRSSLFEAKEIVLKMGSDSSRRDANYARFVKDYLRRGKDREFKDSLLRLERKFRP